MRTADHQGGGSRAAGAPIHCRETCRGNSSERQGREGSVASRASEHVRRHLSASAPPGPRRPPARSMASTSVLRSNASLRAFRLRCHDPAWKAHVWPRTCVQNRGRIPNDWTVAHPIVKGPMSQHKTNPQAVLRAMLPELLPHGFAHAIQLVLEVVPAAGVLPYPAEHRSEARGQCLPNRWEEGRVGKEGRCRWSPYH